MATVNRRQAGFTLIELLAVLAIMALIIGISVGAFHEFGKGAGMRAHGPNAFRAAMTAVRKSLRVPRQMLPTNTPSWPLPR